MHTFAPFRVPTASKVEAYTRARELQQQVRKTGEDMALLDNTPGDLDPAPDAVTIDKGTLPSLPEASGTARFKDGKLVDLLLLESKGGHVAFRELDSGLGYVSMPLQAVESPDGALCFDEGRRPLHKFVPQESPNPSRSESFKRLTQEIYSPAEMEAYIQARHLQQRIRQAGEEMAALDGQPFDFDPAKGAVEICNRPLASMTEASGSATIRKGRTTSLELHCKEGDLQLRKLPGATAYIGENLVVVESRDGSLWIDTEPGQNLEACLERMHLPGLGKRVLNGLSDTLAVVDDAYGRAFHGALDAVADFFLSE